MKTPDDDAGKLVERIMTIVRGECCPTIFTYNRVYSAVYQILKTELPDERRPERSTRLSESHAES